MKIRPFAEAAESAVISLWLDCELVVPWNDPAKDIARKLAVDPGLFLVGEVAGTVIATVMAGYEGHRGWINYLAVHPDHRRGSYGRQMMAEAEQALAARGCPKVNLQIRASNTAVVAFYESLGYRVDEVVSMGKRLEED